MFLGLFLKKQSKKVKKIKFWPLHVFEEMIFNILNIDKEKIKENIERLKKHHFIKRRQKLFFKKDKEKQFIILNNMEFLNLFISFNLFRNSVKEII